MEHNTNEWVEPVLTKYRLQPEFIESVGNVKKVMTKHGIFALKRLKNKHQLVSFQISKHLYDLGYTKITPVFRTIDHTPYVYYHNQYYYLMPWYQSNVNQERHDHQERLLTELARLHDSTVKMIPIHQEELLKTYETILMEWGRKTLFLEEFMDSCERSIYLSPFELQYCMMFHEAMGAIHFSKDRLKEWYELSGKKANSRIVVNHGNISSRHFVYDQNDNGVFISFENAKYTLPIYDLIRYYHKVLRTYPIQSDEYKDWYFYYQRHFPYTKEEKALFFSYFAFPEGVYRTVRKYKENKHQSEQQAVNHLLKGQWQMKNIEYVATRIMEEEQKIAEQTDKGATS